MKKKSKKSAILLVFAIVVSIVGFLGYWAGKYYGVFYSEQFSNTYYESLQERAAAAKVVAKRNKLSEEYCFFVDYGIPSGTPRLFVWSYKDNKVVASTYVMHGPGLGSTAEKPVFSNRSGSNCSSLGRFAVTKQHGTKLKRSYRLRGLDIDNKNALSRGLLVHSSSWVDANCWRKYIPLHAISCKGCVTVSSRGISYLENLINSQDKQILLWSYCSEQN